MATAKKAYARYYIVRGLTTMWQGDPATSGSLFRQVAITSNEFNSTQGVFQVFALEGPGGGIKDGKFARSDAEPTVLADKDFNGLDESVKEFDRLVDEAEQLGFKTISIMDIMEFEDKARRSQ